MTKLNFLIAPDFAPSYFAGWHMLNTLLQRRSGIQLHLLMPENAQQQAEMLRSQQVDLVYANPFDSAQMVRSDGYLAMARPRGKSDEMVMATAANSPLNEPEDLKKGCSIALTDNRDVKLIGLRLLEPADIGEGDIQWQEVETYQAVARMTIKGEVDAGFFLAETWHTLSKLARSQLKVLVESALRDITHVVLAHPAIEAQLAALRAALLGIGQNGGDQDVLDALGLPDGFEPMEQEDAEFMIDLMDTLQVS